MHLPSHRLGKLMLKEIDAAIAGSNLIIHLVDTQEPPGEEEGFVLGKLKNVKVPVILGLNKIDCHPRCLPSYIKLWEERKGKEIQELGDQILLVPLSGKTGTNVEQLLATIFQHLPQGDFLYPPEILTDFPQRLAIADIIREKLFSLMRQEVPHSLAVYIDEMQPRSSKLIYLRAVIIIERPSQKAIVVGKGAEILKTVGLKARPEIETLLGQKVYLETHVKVKPGWREDPEILKLLGYI
jgi:GTP-binding protein Era